MQTINDVPMILRREIEIRMIAPFLEAFSKKIGKEETRRITQEVISVMAEEAGKGLAKGAGVKTLSDIREKVVPMFEAGGALKVEYGESTAERLCWNITKCDYVGIFRKIGREDLGTLLSCQRDEFLFRGINPDIKFTRKRTLMEGAPCCDFCLELRDTE